MFPNLPQNYVRDLRENFWQLVLLSLLGMDLKDMKTIWDSAPFLEQQVTSQYRQQQFTAPPEKGGGKKFELYCIAQFYKSWNFQAPRPFFKCFHYYKDWYYFHFLIHKRERFPCIFPHLFNIDFWDTRVGL